MYPDASELQRNILTQIAAAAHAPASAAALKMLRALDCPHFLHLYYAGVEAADLAAYEPAELAAAALSHLDFARRRRRGRALVRVFNPTLREHGYSSPHTVAEIVNDDMPFLVDSIGLALAERSLTLHFLAHPIFAAARDSHGDLHSLRGRGDAARGAAARGGMARAAARLESLQHVEIDRIVDPAMLRSLELQIERNLRDVRAACADWTKMQNAAAKAAEDLEIGNKRFDPQDVSETHALLEWMLNRHFTFLGYREYRLRGGPGRESLDALEASGLGILRPGHKRPETVGRISASDIRRQSRSRDLVLVTKANFALHRAPPRLSRLCRHQAFRCPGSADRRAPIPRSVDLGGVQHQPARYSAAAPQGGQVVQHFALAPDSHDGKALQHILESFPRDELFQASVPN
jgi:glutamate dehydrogenase